MRRCGAQDPRAIVPGDPAALEMLLDAGRGHVRAVTLAPETDRIGDLLRICAERGLVASFGHTDAGYDLTARTIDAANALGLTVTATHLFNAMPPVHHREPGAAGALLAASARGEAIVELIADGDYVLGTLPVIVDGGVARLKDGGNIAGGTSTIFDQVMRMLHRGIDPADVARMASATGAKATGFADRGAVAVGKRADLLLCDDAPEGTPPHHHGGDTTPPTVIIAGERKER
ncbi:amidohydrolase family protein [Corynebacterium xerosis]|uniref:amidohydrolase family protein n=1 Tax=Corynebacterium xerosis TaxID=1725 RepID=UPI0027BA4509|nr:amidohydrolase family protein [Corynebacterium xerosis]